MKQTSNSVKQLTWQERLHEIIYEADTKAGKNFDIVLLLVIVLSVLMVVFESVEEIHQTYQSVFFYLEWGITIFFLIEYVLRILCIKSPRRYIFSFYGVIDLLAVLPQFIALYYTPSTVLLALRSLRLLRVFRILQLHQYVDQAQFLAKSLKASIVKITVFLSVVVILSFILGTVMFFVEGKENGFTNIPVSI